MNQSFVILIVLSFAFFLFFKIKVWRTKDALEKKWRQTKANIALGSFMLFFGLNLLVLPRSIVDIIIGIVFALLGVINIMFGYRAYKYYLQQVTDVATSEQTKGE